MSKIFGIGMPKTATTSLHDALGVLGYRSIHFVHDKKTLAELRAQNYRLSVVERYDAISDAPIPAIFQQLDEAWPNSKFILTVRELDKWIDSCRNAPFNAADKTPDPDDYRYFYRTLVYGQAQFDEEVFAQAYKSHHERVQNYFTGDKENQLLVMDITKGDGWEKLCPFLDIPIPQKDFPCSNPRKSGSQSSESSKPSLSMKKIKYYVRNLVRGN